MRKLTAIFAAMGALGLVSSVPRANAVDQLMDNNNLIPISTGANIEFIASYTRMHSSTDAIEGQIAGSLTPFHDTNIDLAPRVGAMRAWGRPYLRTDISIGEQNRYWIGRYAPGLAVDWVFSTYGTGTHFRLEPFVDARVWTILRTGALGFRLGLPYESRFLWGVRGGITLQFDGVPEHSS